MSNQLRDFVYYWREILGMCGVHQFKERGDEVRFNHPLRDAHNFNTALNIKKGVWVDFVTRETGNLLTFFADYNSIENSEAYRILLEKYYPNDVISSHTPNTYKLSPTSQRIASKHTSEARQERYFMEVQPATIPHSCQRGKSTFVGYEVTHCTDLETVLVCTDVDIISMIVTGETFLPYATDGNGCFVRGQMLHVCVKTRADKLREQALFKSNGLFAIEQETCMEVFLFNDSQIETEREYFSVCRVLATHLGGHYKQRDKPVSYNLRDQKSLHLNPYYKGEVPTTILSTLEAIM
jgi:hypothetical protein